MQGLSRTEIWNFEFIGSRHAVAEPNPPLSDFGDIISLSIFCFLVLIAKGASITLLGPMKLQQSERQCLVDYHPQNTAQTDD